MSPKSAVATLVITNPFVLDSKTVHAPFLTSGQFPLLVPAPALCKLVMPVSYTHLDVYKRQVLPVEADVHTVEQVPGFANVSVSGVPVTGVMVSVKLPVPKAPFIILKCCTTPPIRLVALVPSIRVIGTELPANVAVIE